MTISERDLEELAREMCKRDGVDPDEIFLCDGCDTPHPNWHNHLGYAEAFMEAAKALGYQIVRMQ